MIECEYLIQDFNTSEFFKTFKKSIRCRVNIYWLFLFNLLFLLSVFVKLNEMRQNDLQWTETSETIISTPNMEAKPKLCENLTNKSTTEFCTFVHMKHHKRGCSVLPAVSLCRISQTINMKII